VQFSLRENIPDMEADILFRGLKELGDEDLRSQTVPLSSLTSIRLVPSSAW